MSTTTTDTTDPERQRLYAVEKQLRTEMALLYPTQELMMKYEKLYILANDNIMHHAYPNINEYREYFNKIKHARPDIVPIGVNEDSTRAFYDWNQYFLVRKPIDYWVSAFFKH
jgi:hypothetical protein